MEGEGEGGIRIAHSRFRPPNSSCPPTPFASQYARPVIPPFVEPHSQGKASVMRAWRSAYSCPPWFRILVACGTILTLAGCNAAPFHSARSSGTPPPVVKGQTAESTIDDAGWPSSPRSGDADQKAQYHEVRAGDTLSSVAKMYGLTPARLLNSNGLDTGEGLKPGQLLYIPRSL
jgi:hypothetical protein